MDEEIPTSPGTDTAANTTASEVETTAAKPAETAVPEPRKITFDWCRYTYGSTSDEHGDPEVVDVPVQLSATIIEPEPDKVLEEQRQSVLCWQQEFNGERYAVFKRDTGYVAARTDVWVGPHDASRIELRAVTLAGEKPTPAWEVYFKSTEGAWVPVENQHLQSRTATAEQWLEEIEKTTLPKLIAQRTELIGEYHAVTESAPVAFHPAAKPLNYDSAFALARNAIVGCDYDQHHARAFAAENDFNHAHSAFENHRAAGKRHGWKLCAPWVGLPHYQKDLRLRHGLKKAARHYLKAREQVSELQQRADATQLREQIDQGAKQLLAAQKLRGQAELAARQVAEAEKLVAHLRQNPQARVTLQQTRIQGRQALCVPKLPAGGSYTRKLGAALKAKI